MFFVVWANETNSLYDILFLMQVIVNVLTNSFTLWESIPLLVINISLSYLSHFGNDIKFTKWFKRVIFIESLVVAYMFLIFVFYKFNIYLPFAENNTIQIIALLMLPIILLSLQVNLFFKTIADWKKFPNKRLLNIILLFIFLGCFLFFTYWIVGILITH